MHTHTAAGTFAAIHPASVAQCPQALDNGALCCNKLLQALPAEDCEDLLPTMERVYLPAGMTLYEAGDPQKYLYFPCDAVVAQNSDLMDGTSVEFSLTGHEGMVGLALLLGGGSTPSRAVVQCPGYACRLKLSLLEHHFARGGPLRALLLRYAMALMAQAGQAAACNRHHSVRQRLCTLILSYLDRLPAHRLNLSQESIAQALGVRRESVTESALELQALGLIHYSRGKIDVLHRAGLKERACECYAVVRAEEHRLLPGCRTAQRGAARTGMEAVS